MARGLPAEGMSTSMVSKRTSSVTADFGNVPARKVARGGSRAVPHTPMVELAAVPVPARKVARGGSRAMPHTPKVELAAVHRRRQSRSPESVPSPPSVPREISANDPSRLLMGAVPAEALDRCAVPTVVEAPVPIVTAAAAIRSEGRSPDAAVSSTARASLAGPAAVSVAPSAGDMQPGAQVPMSGAARMRQLRTSAADFGAAARERVQNDADPAANFRAEFRACVRDVAREVAEIPGSASRSSIDWESADLNDVRPVYPYRFFNMFPNL